MPQADPTVLRRKKRESLYTCPPKKDQWETQWCEIDIRAGFCQHACNDPPALHFIAGFGSGGDGGGLGVGGLAAFGGRPRRADGERRLAYAGALAVTRVVPDPGQLPPSAPAKRDAPLQIWASLCFSPSRLKLASDLDERETITGV